MENSESTGGEVRLERQVRPREWIACSERMPEVRHNVLFFDQWDCADDRMKCGWWTGRYWEPNAEIDGEGIIETVSEKAVTHWMPLPDPPAV